MALVGRDAQRAQLAAWLAARAARAGAAPAGSAAPAALFVTGEAGVGKTALVEASLPAGTVVRRATAVPWQPSPYGVLDQLVPGVLPREPDTVRAALLDAGRPLVVVLDDLHWSDDATL